MPGRRKLMLPFTHWPIEDRRRWEVAFQSGDLFDENGAGTRLAAATRHLRLESYGRFLGFLSVKHPKLMTLPPEGRIDRRMAAEYVAHRRRSCGDISLAADLGSLCSTLRLLCPNTDFSWLRSIANRIAAAAPPPARKYNQVTSDRLYALGIELMDCAVTAADAVGHTGTRQAIQYRDGLIISTLAMIPLRRSTLAALQIGRHLIKVGDHWELDIPAADTKTRRPLDYSIPSDLSCGLICTWNNSAAVSGVLKNTPAFGRHIIASQCGLIPLMSPCTSEPGKPLDRRQRTSFPARRGKLLVHT